MEYASMFEDRTLEGCVFEVSPAPAPQLDSSAMSEADLPSKVDLRPYCTAVEDQGRIGSCVANAIVGAVEMLANKNGTGAPDLSRLFLYYNARAIGKCENIDAGTQIHHAMAALLAHGVCEERMWPYQPAAVNTMPTQGCYQNATHYETIQFARTPGEAALYSLARELPVVFGIVLPRECYQVARETGMVPMPDIDPLAAPPGGHAMLAVGYDLDEQYFIVRNSWGAGYGKGGYIAIPFAVMQAYAHPHQFFTIGAIEGAPGLKIFGEAVEANVMQMAAAATSIPTPDFSQLRAGIRNELEGRLDAAKKGFASRLRGGP